MIEKFHLDGKRAVVIGGGGNIGFAIVKGLKELGVNVVIADKRELMDSQTLADRENTAKVFDVDVTCEKSVVNLVKQVKEEMGGTDILVNAQGVNYKNKVVEIDINEWDFLQSVNSRGVLVCSKAFIPGMIEQQSGRIISISSVRGIRGSVMGDATYGSSKSVVDSLTRAMAIELGKYGVTVNAIGPTVVEGALMGNSGKEIPEEHRLELIEKHPLGRLCRTEDCAALVAFLASDAASYISGQTIYLDGAALAVL